LGDLTLLVGPQASGKSLFLQTLKAVQDLDAIVGALKRHGYDWRSDNQRLVELFYGEGMGGLFGPSSEIRSDDVPWSLLEEANESWSKGSRKTTRAFYIPAQRVLTIQEGWPRPFTAFDVGAPFVVKEFSEDLRRLLEDGLGGDSDQIFPAERRWKQAIRRMVDESIFHGSVVHIDRSQLRKRIVLTAGGEQLPFMSWSAGQREFIPLMLGLYWLMPAQATPRRQKIELVIIEEPEMGLHPRAITALALAVLDLVKRDYRVVLSTHSPHLVELTWALRSIQGSRGFEDAFCELFDTRPSKPMRDLASEIASKSLRVYSMAHQPDSGQVYAKDISSLDPNSEDPDIAGWGGLTDFAERAGEVVAKQMNMFGAT